MSVRIFQAYAFGLAGIGFALSFGSSGTAAAGAFVGAGLFAIEDSLASRSVPVADGKTAAPANVNADDQVTG